MVMAWASLGVILSYYAVKSWPYLTPTRCILYPPPADSGCVPKLTSYLGSMQGFLSDMVCFLDPPPSSALSLLFCQLYPAPSILLGNLSPAICLDLIFSAPCFVLIVQHGFQICQSLPGISKSVFLKGLKFFHNFFCSSQITPSLPWGTITFTLYIY